MLPIDLQRDEQNRAPSGAAVVALVAAAKNEEFENAVWRPASEGLVGGMRGKKRLRGTNASRFQILPDK